MASIDANILLQGIVPDVNSAVRQGIETGQLIKNAPILRRMREQQVAQNEQAQQLNQQRLAAGELSAGQNEAMATFSILGDTPVTADNFGQATQLMLRQRIPLQEDDLVPTAENIQELERIRQSGKVFAERARGGGQTGFQTNAPIITEETITDPETGETRKQKFFTSLQTDRATGEQRASSIPISGEITDRLGLSAGDRVTQKQAEAIAGEAGRGIGQAQVSDITSGAKAQETERVTRAKKLAESAVEASDAAFASAANLESANAIYDSAISALEAGAETGAAAKFIPTVRTETLKLQEAIRKAGLNTISGVTLGAISKPELDLALSTDIDERMNEDDLLEHLKEKKAAQAKVAQELKRMGSFLAKEGNTVAKWNDLQSNIGKRGVKLSENSVPNNSIPTVTTQEEFDALPSGAEFIEDGVRRRKQ